MDWSSQITDNELDEEIGEISSEDLAFPSQRRFDKQRTWQRVPASVVKSAGRALQILEFFDDTRRPANMTEISRGLGYPESSTSILLRSLAVLGYLSYDRRKRTYRPTSRVRLLGSWVDAPLFQNDRVLRLMDELNAEIEDAIILASRNGLNSQYIHVVQARTALRLHLTPGTARSITQSTTGWVMLSRLSDNEIGKLVRRTNSEVGSLEQIIRIPEIIEKVEAIRRDGYILSESLVTPGCSVLAMPLPAHLSENSLVLAVAAPSNRLDEQRRQSLVELMTQRIREHLGN